MQRFMESLTKRFNEEVFNPYVELLKAQYRIHPNFDYVKKIWEEKLTYGELVNGPYLEKSQSYESGEPLSSLHLHEKTTSTIKRKFGDRNLWQHQTEAIKLLKDDKNVIIATGTSSGKTICYQIPILDDLLQNPAPGLRAIIIYPLNALVNDQLREWGDILKDHKQITFARFTGQTPPTQINYEEQLKKTFREQLSNQGLTKQQLEIEVSQRLKDRLRNDPPNCLNNREAIRLNPPHILVTNFSMLEYLLVRPIDAPIFQNSRLNFLVLDEAHSYRGIQATEIAFLIRRIKERLNIERLTCIATSATLGDKNNPESKQKVREFANNLFGESFNEPNPIYGMPAEPVLEEPSFCPKPRQYIDLARKLHNKEDVNFKEYFNINISNLSLAEVLCHDENLLHLRKEILSKPILLNEAAANLWPDDPQATDGLQALLKIVSISKEDQSHNDLLPTRLHYFVKAQDGLHVCLHKECPERKDGKPAFFVSRNENPEGNCPACEKVNQRSKLVEVVTCRKCGYLYGALQDLGPRRAQNPESNGTESFNSFSTELGWAGDSFWSYFSLDDELPYPIIIGDEEDDEQDNLMKNPAELDWCVSCGKKNDQGAGDNCQCEISHLRKIKIFHRQCPDRERQNLYKQNKELLKTCPNCGTRNASGLEPLRRFQESEDETGLAMAIPLSHFQINQEKEIPQLLCFTDHRQRAAAFPSLLEEETFSHDMGRKIVKTINERSEHIDIVTLGEQLAEIAEQDSDKYDSDFFLPVSRLPDDENISAKEMCNLWIAETFSYFGIPDSARESAEDLGLVAVEYRINDSELAAFHSLLQPYNISYEDSCNLLQIFTGYIRQKKAFTLPNGIDYDSPAFGRVKAEISFALRRDGSTNIGWLPKENQDGSYLGNAITDYLKRLFNLADKEILDLAEDIWDYLTSHHLLIEKRDRWKLDCERIFVIKPRSRYVCTRCGKITPYSVQGVCPKKGCGGRLEAQDFDATRENIIARWVAGQEEIKFKTLKSEEHTAQIRKTVAEEIENQFRNGGVNLLSSTTTFEMGINIGDLQKVFLRNAPPSSANYVQRVGRAGRGKDKNSVCVTLCRRTKYDADAWKEPPRLMSGKVRTPTVFMENRLIAQRHFNAIVFSKFLRIKILDEKVLKNEQEIPIGMLIGSATRKGIPENWMKFPSTLYLDFTEWFKQQKREDILRTNAGDTILSVVFSYENAVSDACDKYNKIIALIGNELEALIKERNRLHAEGIDTTDINNSIKNLLDSDVISVLAKNGFLPRYAFPLDVVSLETGKTRWSGDKRLPEEEVDLSRDRSIAISEFAPGAQVIARKRVYTSAGLYVVSPKDIPDIQWYSRCSSCEQIRTGRLKKEIEGNCLVCEKKIQSRDIKSFIEPSAFSVSLDDKEKGNVTYRRSTFIRQRQSLTHFIDNIENSIFLDTGLFSLALKDSGKLFRYNLGPRNEGFIFCNKCGRSEPKSLIRHGRSHKKLRDYYLRRNNCEGQYYPNPIAYGHQFESYCLIIRPVNQPESVHSLAYAIQKGVCDLLELDPYDIGVSWRWLGNRQTGSAKREIILYDNTPGGAGFVKEVYDNWSKVLDKTIKCCSDCKCEKACYDCLKHYGNQIYHDNLDRKKVISFLSY